MAKVPRRLIEDMSGAVNALSEDALSKLGNALSKVDLSDIAAARDAVIDVMELFLGPYTDMAAVIAAEFYDSVREIQVGKRTGAIADSRRDPMATAGAVRSFMQDVVDGKPREQFVGKLLDRADSEIRRAANECVAHNVQREGSHVKYARVPSGAETCRFCIMLASRGAVYRSSEAAGHAHPNCDCRVVPDFGGGIDGYDPDDMYKRLGVCEEAIGGNDGIREKWNALPKEKRNVYVAKHGKDAYQKFKNKCIVQELETRDPEWLRTGKAPAIDYSKSPRSTYGRMLKAGDYSPENIVDRGNEWRDLYAHDLLASNGFKIEVRPAKAPDGIRNVDLLIGGKLWEVKSPGNPNDSSAGSNLRFVENNLRSAVKQFLNQYDESTKGRMEYKGPIRVVFSSYYRSANDDDIESELLRMMKMHNVDEVLHCRKDGKVTHLKKR